MRFPRHPLMWLKRRPNVHDRLWRTVDDVLWPAVHSERTPLRVTAWFCPGEPVPIAEALAATYKPLPVGGLWGAPWSTAWFHLVGEVPASFAGRPVDAILDIGFSWAGPGFQAEGLVLDAEGRVIRGIHPRNHTLMLGRPAQGGERIDWYVEAAGNPDILAENSGNTPRSDIETSDKLPLYRFKCADLAVRDETVYGLAMDLDVLGRLFDSLPDGERTELNAVLTKALEALDPKNVHGTAQAARDILAKAWRPAPAKGHRVSAVGHAHIDTAWLWPIRETKRKASRTFANVVDLGGHYPELRFAGSQAQQYAWVKERHPDLFERIKAAVTAGTFVPVGGAWVEADGNLPGGEALARQLVHGKRFFRDEFGVTTRGVWLPDSFGYTAAYPQIAKLAGNDWFLTQKLSWNDTNTFPHHTLWWEGLDGTRIFTHFPPADTYNGSMEASELRRSVANFKHPDDTAVSLYPFGYGDGGGGPTPEMLERARRSTHLDGLPEVVVEGPDAFFDRARAEFAHAPVWRGELYLELHRGTFTSQARGKHWNRRVEHLFREAELWTATASLGEAIPGVTARLDALWKRFLTTQFHDILPGSSIGWVHREQVAELRDIASELEDVIASATRSEGGGAPVVLNASPFPRREPVLVPAGVDGQRVDGGALLMASVAGGGSAALGDAAADDAVVTVEETGDGIVLASPELRVAIDRDGLLSSVVTPDGFEALAGRANLLRLHSDTPHNWEAWDIELDYRKSAVELTAAESVAVVERGPLRAAVRVTRRYRSTTIVQTYRVTAGVPRVDIVTEVDWQERRTLLKAVFPLDVLADSERAETQYGFVHRPIHENTSWQRAAFERCQHRYVWVGEGRDGIALITDSTYGHDTSRDVAADGRAVTTIGLSLLRGPMAPDPRADLGRHEFTYSLCPGTHELAIQQGYALNLPLRVGTAAFGEPLVALDERDDGAVIEAVKQADDGSGDLIVRLYESRGGRAARVLRCARPLTSAIVTDLLEDPLPDGELPLASKGVEVRLRPFQILTLRLKPRV